MARARTITVPAVGAPDDPQNCAAQVERLEAAGAWVLPSNAQAARAAAAIAGGEAVVTALLRPGARA